MVAKPILLRAIKLGEYPPFGSHLAKRLQDMLSKADLEPYRKRLRTEREGHGIGAAAYFRRGWRWRFETRKPVKSESNDGNRGSASDPIKKPFVVG
jgi:hypothetical protein